MGKDGRLRNIIFTSVRRVRAQNCLSHALSFLHSVQTQGATHVAVDTKFSVLYAYSEPGGRKDAQQIFGAESGSCSQRGARKRTQRIVLWKPAPVNEKRDFVCFFARVLQIFAQSSTWFDTLFARILESNVNHAGSPPVISWFHNVAA
jgi:hypothetical protein